MIIGPFYFKNCHSNVRTHFYTQYQQNVQRTCLQFELILTYANVYTVKMVHTKKRKLHLIQNVQFAITKNVQNVKDVKLTIKYFSNHHKQILLNFIKKIEAYFPFLFTNWNHMKLIFAIHEGFMYCAKDTSDSRWWTNYDNIMRIACQVFSLMQLHNYEYEDNNFIQMKNFDSLYRKIAHLLVENDIHWVSGVKGLMTRPIQKTFTGTQILQKVSLHMKCCE